MKSIFAFICITALAYSAQAFKDGIYSCRNEKAGLEISYKIKSLTVGGVTMPHLEVTQTYEKNPNDPNGGPVVYVAKGLATQFVDNAGGEMLALGAMRIELKEGRPACRQ